jgi:outer membrane protein TolC
VVGGITGVEDVDQLWQVRLALPIPLWQRNQGEQARAAAEVAQARFEMESFEFHTNVAVRAAVRNFNDAADLYRLYLERSGRVREDLALVRAAYVDGRIAFESYLTQKGRLVDTLLDQLEAEDQYWEARGALETALAANFDALRQGGSR